ncbi:MAG: hypothetical protein H0X63_05030 [Flavobacteriales bacterium]|nr:hypothetical protein [Flavobacteriales bacterium]
MENDINEVLILKIKYFEENMSIKSDSEKKIVHYNSVKNISNRIVLYNNKKTVLLKEKLIIYLQKLEDSGYTIENKYKGSSLFIKYISPSIIYLLDNDKFLVNSDIRTFIIIGFIIDLIVYYFISDYHYPLFILLFSIFGIYRRIKAKKEGKYAAMFW